MQHEKSGNTKPAESNPPRHRPLLPVLMGFATGIAAEHTLAPPLWFWAALGCCLMALAAWAVRRELKPWGNWAVALLLVITVGGAYHHLRSGPKPPWHLANRSIEQPTLYHLRGRVREAPDLHYRERALAPEGRALSDFWLLRVDLTRLSSNGREWRRAAGGIAVFVDGVRPGLSPGDTVEFMGFLRTNAGPTNPGERNRARAYRRAGSFATASVDSADGFRVVGRAPWWDPRFAVDRLRTTLKRRLIWDSPRPISGLTAALVFGQRSRMKPDLEELLKDSGMLHFLAISGLHVGIFAGLVWLVLLWLGVPVRLRSAVLIAMVWLYVLFTGAHVSALRAGCMLTFAAAAPLVRRRYDFLSALAAAVLVILLIAPTQLFSPGFQLSFMAVWAIVYLFTELADILWPWESLVLRLQQPEQRSFLSDVWYLIRRMGLLAVCLWAAMAPVRAFHFHRLSLWQPVLCVLMWPLVLSLLLSGFVLALWGLLGLPGLAVAAMPAHYFSNSVETLLSGFSHLPGFVHFTPGPPVWWVLLFYVAVSAWVFRQRVVGGRQAFLGLALVLSLTYVWADFSRGGTDSFRMTVADVGSGQAVVLRPPGGQALVYDAGSSSLSSRRRLAEMLWYRRIRHIDPLIISHRNYDHCSFVPYLARRFSIGRVLLPPTGELSALGARLRRSLRRRGLSEEHAMERTVVAGSGLRCTVLHPDSLFATNRELHPNERSLVLRCKFDRFTCMLTGDAGAPALSRLCRRHGRDLRADLLLLPHHGRHADGLAEFLRLVSPRAAVASCGDEVDLSITRRLLDRSGIPLWTTAEDGAVIIELKGHLLTVKGYDSGRRQTFDLRRERRTLTAAGSEKGGQTAP